MKFHDFRQQNPRGYWEASDNCRYCGQPAAEAESGQCLDRPVSKLSENTAPPSLPEQELSLTTPDYKIRITYGLRSQTLSFYKIRTLGGDQLLEKHNLAGKHVVAQVLPQNTPGKAIKGAVGGAVLGSLLLPVVGTAIGAAAGGKGKSKRAIVSVAGEDVNCVFEVGDVASALHLVNSINSRPEQAVKVRG